MNSETKRTIKLSIEEVNKYLGTTTNIRDDLIAANIFPYSEGTHAGTNRPFLMKLASRSRDITLIPLNELRLCMKIRKVLINN